MTREEIARGLRCSASTGEKDCEKCPWGIREEFEGGVWESCDCDRMAVEAADLLENDGSQVLALQRELELKRAQLDCASASAEKLRRQNGELREAAAQVTKLAADAAEREWISVEDRLPEPGVDVLAAYRDRHINMGTAGDDWLEEDIADGNITHWMPLPQSPREEK